MARHIVIVEDEATIRHNYEDALRRYGYRVTGFGDRPSALAALQRRLPDLVIIDVGLGDDHGCARKTDGRVFCWADNDYGQLGIGTTGTADVFTPTAVLPEMSFSSVGPGNDHACAATVAGATYCWGRNSYGQLGLGDVLRRRVVLLVLTRTSGNQREAE